MQIIEQNKLTLFETALKSGCNVEESLISSGVTREEYKNYCGDNPGYADLNVQWQQIPVIDSKLTLAKFVKTDSDLALKYLERKKKDEFSLRNELTGAGGKDLIPDKIIID